MRNEVTLLPSDVALTGQIFDKTPNFNLLLMHPLSLSLNCASNRVFIMQSAALTRV